MILIDSRTGSKELLPYFTLPTTLIQLEFADFCFYGKGPNNEIFRIGIERKTISDLAQCIVDGRLVAHQLPGLTNNYNRVYVIVEGIFRNNKDSGFVEYYATRGFWKGLEAGRFNSESIRGFLHTLEEKCGVRVIFTSEMKQTAECVSAVFAWWQKDYDKHGSNLAIHHRIIEHTPLLAPSLTCRIAAELPGIGAKKAKLVADYFSSVKEMINSEPITWSNIKGIGIETGRKVVEAIRKENKQ